MAGPAAAGSEPSADTYVSPGLDPYADSIQPLGVGTEVPKPLSSQTKSIGTGRPRNAVASAVLIAPTALEWFAEASPKEHSTTASSGHSQSTLSRCARCSAIARPTDLGRCEAMVEVCGMTARSGCPNTLCRPPAIGSSASPISPCSTSRIGVDPGTCLALDR